MTILRPLTTSHKIILTLMTIALVTLFGAAGLSGSQVPCELYDTQVQAALKMQDCAEAIKAEKLARGIDISSEDRFATGLIGEDFNFLTSTRGDIAAKRTSVTTDMAALMVRMLQEAGLQAGDTLACNFSGSFPGFNIAVLCACEAMDITPAYICSAGASTWGANNPGYSFPEMADTLIRAGLICHEPLLITPGAGGDTGKGVDEELFAKVWERVCALGYPVYEEEDFETNVNYRMALYEEAGADAFIAVGGNITSLGRNMITDLVGQGIIGEAISGVNSGSGLLERYIYEGTPSILILNIRQLAADYGLTFDPETEPVIGEGSIYYETEYSRLIPTLVIACGLALMAAYRGLTYKSKGHR